MARANKNHNLWIYLSLIAAESPATEFSDILSHIQMLLLESAHNDPSTISNRTVKVVLLTEEL